MKNKALLVTYGLTFIGLLLPSIRWGSLIDWDVELISALTLFPLFGMWAFTMMWAHFMAGPLRRRYPDAMDYESWLAATSKAVLVLLFFHPGLLIIDAAMEGYSTFDYVGESGELFLLFGIVAWFGFMLWEVAHRLRNHRLVKKYARLVEVINIVAFVLVFFHGLELGQHLQAGWLRAYWWFMAAGFVFVMADRYLSQRREKTT